MEVEQLTIPKKKAEEELEALKQVFKQHNLQTQDQVYKDMAKVYGHLQHGKKIIDIVEAFKKTGLNENQEPKLAICRADRKQVVFEKNTVGGGDFRYLVNANHFGYGHHVEVSKSNDFHIPQGTFPRFLTQDGKIAEYYYRIHNATLQTIVPIIPPSILVEEVKALLPNYHILWEVEQWKPFPPKDPILLKKLTPNLFGVLATWNLTELERAIIRGRIS